MAEFFHVFQPGGVVSPGLVQQAELVSGQQLELSQNYPPATPEALQLVTDWFPEGLTQHGIRYLLAQGSNPSRAVELFAEAVRRTEFEDRPSRLTSVFGTQTLPEAQVFEA